MASSVNLPDVAIGLLPPPHHTKQKNLFTKHRARREQLKLDVSRFDDLFHLAPVSEYELSQMARGPYASMKVGSAQTNDDAKEEEAQTEEVGTRQYGVQVPGDRDTAFEGERTAESGGSSSGGRAALSSSAAAAGARGEADKGLASFMERAGRKMMAAMRDSGGAGGVSLLPIPNNAGSAGGISQGQLVLQQDALLGGRPVAAISYSPGVEPLVLVAYQPVGAATQGADVLARQHGLPGQGLLCVWDLSRPAQPQAVMASEGSPSCCCWAPLPLTNVAFAGMEEGGVCAWQLDEPASRHPTETVSGGDGDAAAQTTVVTRRPSYSTEHLAEASTCGPIVAVVAIAKDGGGSGGGGKGRSALSRGGGGSGSACQLLALSGWGHVDLYNVMLLSQYDSAAGDLDLGLRVGSRLRLVNSNSSIRLGMQSLRRLQPAPMAAPVPGGAATTAPAAPLADAQMAFCMQLLSAAAAAGSSSSSGPPATFVVGSDAGKVLRGCWAGAPPAPKEYAADDRTSVPASAAASAVLPSRVTSLHASPFCPHAFLAGHSDGTVALHSARHSYPALMWPELARGGVVAVRWSPLRPCVFLVQDAVGVLHLFDLSASTRSPLVSEPLAAATQGQPVTALGVKDGRAQRDAAGRTLCVGFADGRVSCHAVREALCRRSGGQNDTQDELDALLQIVGGK